MILFGFHCDQGASVLLSAGFDGCTLAIYANYLSFNPFIALQQVEPLMQIKRSQLSRGKEEGRGGMSFVET